MKPHLALLVLCLCADFTFAQTQKIDSLNNLLQTLTDAKSQAQVLNSLSLAHRTIDFDKSIDYALKARKIAAQISNQKELGASLLNAGVAYYYKGNYSEALDDFLQALKLYEALEDKQGTIAALNELGTLEKKHGDLESSELHLLKALELSHEISDSTSIANSMNNIGHVYELKNDLKKAMDFYSQSAVIKERMKDFYAASFNYDNIGNILAKQGRYEEAQKTFEKEIRILENLNDKAAYAIALNNLGEMYLMKGDRQLARAYFQNSLTVSTAIGYKDLTSHILNLLSESYKNENNFKKAYEFLVQRNEVKDSIFNEQKSKQILDLRTKYETEKKEKQIVLLRQENEIKDFTLRQNRLFSLGLILVVLSLLLVGYLWQNRTKLKQRAELESTRAALRESQLQAVIASQEAERKRFAADLHDGLGQIISAVRLSLSKDNPEKDTVTNALNLLNDMNVEIRNIAFNLMPRSLMDEGLESALQEFASRINRAGKLQVHVKSYHLSNDISLEQKVALYRVCQEWVNNVIKYADCTRISIQLVQHHEELVLTIEDDGKGFDVSLLKQGQGNGWKNINSRIALLKGNLEIESQHDRQGTIVVINIPSFVMSM
jgi:signal transduction histidine kinase